MFVIFFFDLVFFIGIYFKEVIRDVGKNIYKKMYIVVVFLIIVKDWKQFILLFMWKWLIKVCYNYRMEYYVVIKIFLRILLYMRIYQRCSVKEIKCKIKNKVYIVNLCVYVFMSVRERYIY